MASRPITFAELQKHNSPTDAWIQIGNDVYDVTKFAALHPGGAKILLQHAGTDATEVFYALHRHEAITKYGPRLKVGVMADGEVYEEVKDHGTISEVPYAEGPFWRGWESPYYNESHRAFRAEFRRFVHDELREAAEAGESSGKAPSAEIFRKMGSFGILAARIGPGEHLKLVPHLPGGVKPEDFDFFHACIAHEEIARLGTPSFNDGLGAGMVIGLPPVIYFGPKRMQEQVVRSVLMGEKRICLAITEPTAGSDVAQIMATAVKTADGRHYIVNGVKKWITNGCDSDYFVTAVRTGGEGFSGITLLLIERSKGLETKAIKTSYPGCAGTAYITMEDVLVPVENLIGEEGSGFMHIVYSFCRERWFIICYLLAGVRGTIEECFKWAMQRKAFGEPLIKQPVVRQKLAKMIAEMEAAHSWLEVLTFQMTKMSFEEQAMQLAGPLSLLKYHSTRVAHTVGDDSVQIFGGRGITQTGMGKMIERFARTYKYGAILGGSEEVMADLAIRMAVKSFPRNAKL